MHSNNDLMDPNWKPELPKEIQNAVTRIKNLVASCYAIRAAIGNSEFKSDEFLLITLHSYKWKKFAEDFDKVIEELK